MNAILFMDTSNIVYIIQTISFLIRITFLAIISSNVTVDEAVLSPES